LLPCERALSSPVMSSSALPLSEGRERNFLFKPFDLDSAPPYLDKLSVPHFAPVQPAGVTGAEAGALRTQRAQPRSEPALDV
jgi:hypothetical protein